MKNAKKIGAVVLVAVAVGSLFFLKGQPKPREATPDQAALAPSQDPAKKKGAPATPTKTVAQSKTGEPVPEEIPWMKLPLRHEGNQSVLSISVEPLLWCRLGDLDAVMLDHALSDAKRVLLSLEAVLPEDDSFKPQSRSLKAEDLVNGYRTQFRFESPTKPIQLGLFLCKDSGEDNRCNGKTARDINAVIDENMENVKKDQKYRAPDKIYFFQYLFIDSPRSFYSFQNPNVPDLTFHSVEQHFSKREDVNAKEAILVASLDRAKFLHQTLKSIPLEMGKDSVRVILPRLDTDSGKCKNAQVTNPVQR